MSVAKTNMAKTPTTTASMSQPPSVAISPIFRHQPAPGASAPTSDSIVGAVVAMFRAACCIWILLEILKAEDRGIRQLAGNCPGKHMAHTVGLHHVYLYIYICTKTICTVQLAPVSSFGRRQSSSPPLEHTPVNT